jgi:hypothetical protein
MEGIPLADCHRQTGEDIPSISWSPTLHHSLHISPSLQPALNQLGPHSGCSDEHCFPLPPRWYLARRIFRPRSWRRYVPPERWLTFHGLYGLISQKTVLFSSIMSTSYHTDFGFTLILFFHLRLCLPSGLFSSIFPTTVFKHALSPSVLHVRPSHS